MDAVQANLSRIEVGDEVEVPHRKQRGFVTESHPKVGVVTVSLQGHSKSFYVDQVILVAKQQKLDV